MGITVIAICCYLLHLLLVQKPRLHAEVEEMRNRRRKDAKTVVAVVKRENGGRS